MKVFTDPYTTPGDISHSVDTTWTDVDITSDLGDDAGSVAGVMLELHNTSGTNYTVGVRKNGSTDTLTPHTVGCR